MHKADARRGAHAAVHIGVDAMGWMSRPVYILNRSSNGKDEQAGLCNGMDKQKLAMLKRPPF